MTTWPTPILFESFIISPSTYYGDIYDEEISSREAGLSTLTLSNNLGLPHYDSIAVNATNQGHNAIDIDTEVKPEWQSDNALPTYEESLEMNSPV